MSDSLHIGTLLSAEGNPILPCLLFAQDTPAISVAGHTKNTAQSVIEYWSLSLLEKLHNTVMKSKHYCPAPVPGVAPNNTFQPCSRRAIALAGPIDTLSS